MALTDADVQKQVSETYILSKLAFKKKSGFGNVIKFTDLICWRCNVKGSKH